MSSMEQRQSYLISTQGFDFAKIELPDQIRTHVTERNWEELNQSLLKETTSGGIIFERLLNYMEFSEIEFIISIRSSRNEPDEDGIWHDDGSRILAFSLSLTIDHLEVEGGRLEIRKRSAEPESTKITNALSTPPYGTLIVFATGFQGFEHKINRVIQGERIVVAGWCT